MARTYEFTYKDKLYTASRKRDLLTCVLQDYNLQDNAFYQNFAVWSNKLKSTYTFEDKLKVYIDFILLTNYIKSMRK